MVMGDRLWVIERYLLRGVVLGCLMLTVGCHRTTKHPTAEVYTETADTTGRTGEPGESEKSGNSENSGLSKETGKKLTVQQDTAEVTNLRLLARKQRTIYSPAMMTGEWQRGNEHEQYVADGTGRRWDTGDDMYREEAQAFRWTMDSNLLTLEYHMALGAKVLRQYVVTFVDDETLVYRDAYGSSFMWDKVPAGFTDLP